MTLVFPLILCFLPLILCIVLFCVFAHLKITHQLIAGVLGLAAILPISAIQYFLPPLQIFSDENIFFVLLKSFLKFSLIEESLSFVFLLFLPHKGYSGKNFLFLSFIMGLGLGCFESVVYFLDHLQQSNAIGGVLMYGLVFKRIFTADLIHTFCAGLLGTFIFELRRDNRYASLLIMPIVLHGLYDFFAGFHDYFWYFSIAVILFAAIECRVKYTMYNKREKQ